MTIRFTVFTFLLLLFSQCTIERRLHNKGFHVEWRKKQAFEKNGFQDKIASPEHEPRAFNSGEDLVIREEKTEHADRSLSEEDSEKETDTYDPKTFDPEILLENPPPNDDTIFVSADALGGKTGVTDEEITRYNIAWIVVSMILLGLIILCILAAGSVALDTSLLAFLGLILLIPVLLIVEIVFAANHPRKKFERKLKKAVEHQKEVREMESSPERKEEILEDKRKKSRKAAIFFGAAIVVLLGLAYYLDNIWKE